MLKLRDDTTSSQVPQVRDLVLLVAQFNLGDVELRADL